MSIKISPVQRICTDDGEAEQAVWISRCIDALDAVFPEVLPESEHAIWKSCERLLAHALRCLDGTGPVEEILALASLAYKAAQYLRNCGRYAEAEPLFQRAVHIRERAQGPDHPEVARVLNSLAVLYWYQGKYAQAEPFLQRVLSIREQRLGPDHSDTATILNNLALLYREGKSAQAEALYVRALGAHEHTLGPEHMRVAQVLNNLAEVHQDQGREREAEPLLRQKQGRLDEALAFAQRALTLRSQGLGEGHVLHIERPYERMNIQGVKSLTLSQRSSLKTLGGQRLRLPGMRARVRHEIPTLIEVRGRGCIAEHTFCYTIENIQIISAEPTSLDLALTSTGPLRCAQDKLYQKLLTLEPLFESIPPITLPHPRHVSRKRKAC